MGCYKKQKKNKNRKNDGDDEENADDKKVSTFTQLVDRKKEILKQPDAGSYT